MKISENYQKYADIFLFLLLFFRINFWYYYPPLKYNINAEFFLIFFQNLFEFLGGFSGFFSDFLDNSFLEIPRGPRGIDFIFLDPRGM